jgi:hypothetical protein
MTGLVGRLEFRPRRSTAASTAGCTPPQPKCLEGLPEILEALFLCGNPGSIQVVSVGLRRELHHLQHDVLNQIADELLGCRWRRHNA